MIMTVAQRGTVNSCDHPFMQWLPVQIEYESDGTVTVWQEGTCDGCQEKLILHYEPKSRERSASAAQSPSASQKSADEANEKTLTAEQLRERYDGGAQWGFHPQHAFSQWQDEVIAANTRIGYWEWVAARIQAGETSPPGEGH